jgi:hypothetical protein
VSHWKEKRIINDYLKDHPNPRKTDAIELAKVFKASTNCATIFPKLPSMLTQYFKQWKESQLIKIAGERMKEPYNALLQELAQPMLRETNPAVALQEPVTRTAASTQSSTLPMNERQKDPLSVAPMEAPAQTSYVKTVHTPVPNKRQRCCYQGYCNKWADECGGYHLGLCSQVRQGIVVVPSEEELLHTRRDIKNKKQAKRKAAERERKKKQILDSLV